MYITLHNCLVTGIAAAIFVLAQTSDVIAYSPDGQEPPPVQAKTESVQPEMTRVRIGLEYEYAGENSHLRGEIAHQFSVQSFYPEKRLEHFAWVDQNPRGKRTSLICGWHGAIESIVTQGDGWLVTAIIGPKLNNGGTVVIPRDELYREVYEYRNHHLKIIKVLLPKTNLNRVITFN